jgi:hypothetical protein
MENYKLNEAKKRLEPLSVQCEFCAEGKVTDINDCHYAALYKEADRTNIIVYRSVKYSKIDVGIPRCNACKDIHETAQGRATFTSWMVAIGYLALMFLLFNVVAALFLGLFGAILGGLFLNDYLKKDFINKKDIYNEKDGESSNEMVQDLILMNWSLQPPSA